MQPGDCFFPAVGAPGTDVGMGVWAGQLGERVSIGLRWLSCCFPRPDAYPPTLTHQISTPSSPPLVLEHVEALGPAFREARRVLRDGGTFYLAELHPYCQLDGTQTHVEDETTGETVVIDALTRPVSYFVNTGIEAGFAMNEMDEWRAEGDETLRLLTIRLEAEPVVTGA